MQNEDWLRKVWAERGQKAPAQFEQEIEATDVVDAPELSWLEQHYLLLFNMAASCRTFSFGGALPIAYTAIADVLDRNGLTGTEHASALFVIRRMDEEVLQLWEKESSRTETRKK